MTTTQTRTIDLGAAVRAAVLGDLVGSDLVVETGPSFGRVGVAVNVGDGAAEPAWYRTWRSAEVILWAPTSPPYRIGWAVRVAIGDHEAATAVDPTSILVDRIAEALIEARPAVVDELDPRVGHPHEPYGTPLPRAPLWDRGPVYRGPSGPCPSCGTREGWPTHSWVWAGARVGWRHRSCPDVSPEVQTQVERVVEALDRKPEVLAGVLRHYRG